MRRFPIIGSIFAIVLATVSAQATTITFTLNQDACSGTCGTAPFGTVMLTDNGSGSSAFVTVTETLSASEVFAGTGAGQALEFNVAGPVTIGSITAGFAAGPAPAKASAFGTFLESVTCLTCQGGKSDNSPGPLSFTVSSATGVTVFSFLTNASGYSFSSDILGTNGNTGNVASLAGTATPEPVTSVLTLAGFVLVGVGSLRRFLRA